MTRRLIGLWIIFFAGTVLGAQAAESEIKPATASAPAAPAATPADAAAEPVIIDYNEADLQNVVRTLATKAGVNLIVGDEVTGKVTVHLEGVTYEDAMRLIVESKGYAFLKDKNVVRVKTKESLEAEPVEIRVATLNYAKADDVKKTLEPVLTRQGKLQVDTRSNTLVISDTPSNLSKIMPLIQSLDAQTPQVMIEAKFVETTKNPKKDLGINWSGTLLNHTLTAGSNIKVDGTTAAPVSGFQLSKNLGSPAGPWVPAAALLDGGQAQLVFSFLNQDSDSELLANPRIVTADNSKAKIAIATQYPIPQFTYSETKGAFTISGFEFKDIGIVLTVTPHINKNQFITLDVSPEAGSQSGVTSFQGVNIPIIDNRTANTTVLIKSGNTLAMGGLMRQDVSDTHTKVPIMGDLPGVGAFFRSKSLSKTKRELLIFLTPTIVSPDAQTGLEKFVNGFPNQELYTNDDFMPKDNAKPNPGNLTSWVPKAPPAQPTVESRPAPATQNFSHR